MRRLRVNHRHRAACRKTSKGGANGYVGILYKDTEADSAPEVVGAGDSNPLRYQKWFENLKLGEASSDFHDFMMPQGLVVPKVQVHRLPGISQEEKSRSGGVVTIDSMRRRRR